MATPGGHHGSGRIVVGQNNLSEVRQYLESPTSVVVVTDDQVSRTHGGLLNDALGFPAQQHYQWVIPAGENSKSLREVERLYDFLGRNEVDRLAVVVAFGGGVVGDLAGYVAGTWLRGVRWVNCPTTLLSAVDAAIGGKTGVNHAGRKNRIGVFHPPHGVVVDVSLLATLEDRVFRCGLAESIKHGVIADDAFLNWHTANAHGIQQRRCEVLSELIRRNLAIKCAIVARDLRDESGERARLNFGHTIGHAIEAASTFDRPHGECVALGMMGALYISQEMGLIDANAVDRVRRTLEMFDLPVRLQGLPGDQNIVNSMRQDKKVVSRAVRFVLPSSIGCVTAGHLIGEDAVRRALVRLRQ